jgi:hypothetical protein
MFGTWRRFGALCGVALGLTSGLAIGDAIGGASRASAQVVHRVVGEGADAWRAELEAHGAAPMRPSAPAPAHTSRARLAALVRVEALIAEARAHAGRLDEGAALATLERARRIAEEHADVPGASRWLAEVELTSALVAEQADRPALADQGFRRAASLDPARVVRAAEAAPNTTNRARELALAGATAPASLFVVEVDAPGATVELAGRVIGEAPVEVRAPAGRHVLRVSAPGHLAWGRTIDLIEGRRAPMRVHLGPTEAERARRAWESADTFERARASRPAGTELWWVEARGERALLVRCDDAGCAAPMRLRIGEWPELSPIERALDRSALADARDWIAATPEPDVVPPPPPPRPWYRRWPVWTAVAAGVIAGAVGLGVGLRPEPEQRLRVRIDPSDLTMP